tara:strand:- start:1023 stop:1601 length:579 start_codon:yes stop_codon:yes gene_type:complete
MRCHDTDKFTFRRLLKEIALLMGYEITRQFPTYSQEIQTPIATMQASFAREEAIVVVPILRAGIGMSEGLMELFPLALEGHIGLYRDVKTHRPVEYLVKLPDPGERIFVLVDPMIATGHSAAYSVDVLLKKGVQKEKIIFLALVAAPEGLSAFFEQHPDIPLYTASVDDHLTDQAYITPGLGDAGDRLFGTE